MSLWARIVTGSVCHSDGAAPYLMGVRQDLLSDPGVEHPDGSQVPRQARISFAKNSSLQDFAELAKIVSQILILALREQVSDKKTLPDLAVATSRGTAPIHARVGAGALLLWVARQKEG